MLSAVTLGAAELENPLFVAMNQFQVNPERAGEFEANWRSRESHLQGFDGFVQFALLKGDEAGDYVLTRSGNRAKRSSLGHNRLRFATPTVGACPKAWSRAILAHAFTMR